jgi:hypothetical protein
VCIIQPSQSHIVKKEKVKEIKSRKKGIMLESAAPKAAEVTACQALARQRVRKMQVERQSLCRKKERVWS